MKVTAKAPANIAFIKYWGKADDTLRLPLNDSFSMNMSGAYTITTIEFSNTYEKDEIILLDEDFSEKEVSRVIVELDRMRVRAGKTEKAKVVTKNTFPKGIGSAASASGFAALALAGFAALGVKLSEKELTMFARQGSGSACRSIPDGFVIWEKGVDNESSYAHTLYPPEYWDIRDVLVIVDKRMKKVSTTDGMKTVEKSPYFSTRVESVPKRMKAIKQALVEKNFPLFGAITEEDCLDMHHVMQTQIPSLMYWNDTTRQIMDVVRDWRRGGLPVYFTIDAGPNVHLICEGEDEKQVVEKLQGLDGIEEIIQNRASEGARILSQHLF